MILTQAISFLTGTFAYCPEFMNFWMAVQGAMAVRNGPNKDGKMAGFHAFAQGVLTAFAGGILTPIWMGRPSGMLANDLVIGMCVIAFVLVNYTSFDLGYKILNFFPLRLITVMGAQLFRNRGVVGYVKIGFQSFKDSPSKYYPTPIVGPILNACMLSNMGAFFWKGFHGHLKNGMPMPFQNGLLVASTFHFAAHDQGPIGTSFRAAIEKLPLGDMDAVLFVSAMGSLFMQLTAILQMPEFLGPSFNPFNILLAPFQISASSKPIVVAKAKSEVKSIEMTEAIGNGTADGTKKKRKRRKKKKESKDKEE